MKSRFRNGSSVNGKTKSDVVRCAIYTRKSTEEGLQQDFNSLDAQYEACQAYIASQKHQGWVLLPERYDDGGYTGATMDRPALRRLVTAVEAGQVDVVAAYRLDRFSRYLPDFVRFNELCEQHGCALVSVTEQFSTATPAGRLHLNMLMSFSQHEREVIAERTRYKMGAARRRGKWIGGVPLLGYDIAEGRLVINESEAPRVRQIFALYLETESLLDTVRELNRRGWKTKAWTTRKGIRHDGNAWVKTSLSTLLRNATYTGQIQFEGEVYPGEQPAIVDTETWQQVQRLLKRNNRCGGQTARNKHNALLRGLLVCGLCGVAMSHAYTAKGTRKYRYYACGTAQKRGRDACSTPALPVGEIERFVIDRIRAIGADPKLRAEVLAEVGEGDDRGNLGRQLEEFTPVWETLAPKEQARMIQLLLERIVYDSNRETIALTFRPTGIRTSTEEGTA